MFGRLRRDASIDRHGDRALGAGRARIIGQLFAEALVAGITALACVVPTRRALAIEPTEALRTE